MLTFTEKYNKCVLPDTIAGNQHRPAQTHSFQASGVKKENHIFKKYLELLGYSLMDESLFPDSRGDGRKVCIQINEIPHRDAFLQ